MRVVPDALYRRHPEFDVREQDLRRQVGQFPSEANAPGNHHGGDALQAFGCPIVEFIGLASGFQNSEIIASAQAVPCAFGVRGASTGSAVGKNYSSSFASGSSSRARGSIFAKPCFVSGLSPSGDVQLFVRGFGRHARQSDQCSEGEDVLTSASTRRFMRWSTKILLMDDA